MQENFPQIKKEILEYYKSHASKIETNKNIYNVEVTGWKSVKLYIYGLKYWRSCKQFPILNAALNQIPGMTFGMVSIMEAGTQIRPHMGDTDGVIRHHLGIRIPEAAPGELGIQIKKQTATWTEGELLSFCHAYPHKAWNLTKEHRIIVIVDTVREGFLNRKYEIVSNSLATIAMKYFARKLPFTKKLPNFILDAIFMLASRSFRLLLFVERKFGVHLKSQ